MLELGELFVSFVDTPFVLSFGYLDYVLGVWFFSILGLFDDVLGDGDVEVLFVWLGDGL